MWDSVTALAACKPGGSLLLRIGDVLTSFTVGLLYVLFRNFRLFTIVKPFASCVASSEAFALFVDRAAPVESAGQEAEDASDSTKHLLTVRPLLASTQHFILPLWLVLSLPPQHQSQSLATPWPGFADRVLHSA
jgi:hypothetical protein